MFDSLLSAGCYVVAVSGGVDSVVLLDLLSQRPELDLIVVHFDHGIRDDSADDLEFVKSLAEKYGFRFESKREELGSLASEELARSRRYNFLRTIAKKYSAKLITAHHADDVIETIAINLLRGTGWRGLAVLDSDVIRPLTDMTKSEILDYANIHQLSWHEDSTNLSDKYLRNRIRQKLKNFDNDKKRQLLGLWAQQKYLKKHIDQEVKWAVKKDVHYERKMFADIDEIEAIEYLRYIVDSRLTRPQLHYLLNRIKTSLPNKICQAGNGVNIKFSSRNFTVELIK